MKKLTTYILSIFAIVLFSLSSCKNNGQHSVITKNIARTPDIPKYTLIKIIRTLADYIALPNPTNSGLCKKIEAFQKEYIIGCNTNIPNDTISKVHIGGNFEDNNAYGKSILIFLLILTPISI